LIRSAPIGLIAVCKPVSFDHRSVCCGLGWIRALGLEGGGAVAEE
jgi:hypothetical protein